MAFPRSLAGSGIEHLGYRVEPIGDDGIINCIFTCEYQQVLESSPVAHIRPSPHPCQGVLMQPAVTSPFLVSNTFNLLYPHYLFTVSIDLLIIPKSEFILLTLEKNSVVENGTCKTFTFIVKLKYINTFKICVTVTPPISLIIITFHFIPL